MGDIKKDIEYFDKNKLSRVDLESFCNSLPSDLERKFRGLISDVSALDENYMKDYEKRCPDMGIQIITIQWQHYRKKKFSDNFISRYQIRDLGLFQIKYQEFLIVNGKKKIPDKKTYWYHLNFDTDTGQLIIDKTRVEYLNAKAERLFAERKYNEALAYFKHELNWAKRDYIVYVPTEEKIQKAQAELDAKAFNANGDEFFNQGNFQEAFSFYQRAFNTSNVEVERRIYKENMQKAQDRINL